MIIRYVRDKDGKPIGCVIGLYTDHSMGWSLCCKKDVFNKHMAKVIAVGRALHGTKKDVPRKLMAIYNEVHRRIEDES